MARQSFIWTALPNGFTPDGGSLRLSILLTPRLDPETGARKLQTFFPDWEDWPKTLREARFDITYNGTTVLLAADDTVGANRVDDRLGLADSTVWKALFKQDLFVRPFVFKDLSQHRILSFDSVGMAGLITKLYGDLASKAGDDLPLVSDFVEDRVWSGLVSNINELDRASWDRETGVRNPTGEFERLSSPHERPTPIDTLRLFQLFHTPPAKPKIRHQTRTDDDRIDARWLEYERSALPKKEDLSKEFDFHQVVAAMGSYPTLLRRLGLVVDVLLAKGSFVPAADAALSVRATFPAGTLTVPRTSDAVPETRTLLDPDRFQACSKVASPYQIKDGLLDLDPARFSLIQLDVDGAGLKVMNFARSLWRRGPDESRVDHVTRHEDHLGAPALRTAGLVLVHHDRWAPLKSRFDDNKTGNANLEGQFQGGGSAVQLHAEDLVRGYRVDIMDGMTSKWMSLCRRSARYELDDGAVVVDVPEEETTIRLAATQSSDPASNPDVLYLHEALVAWTGWSLAAPPPGRAIAPDDTVDKSRTETDAEIPPGLKFKSRFRPVKRSLPRLRFGRPYWIRARAVDLAGNSRDYSPDAFGIGEPQEASPYRRHEPIESPVVALLSQAGTIEAPAEGESIARMAIRSFNDTPADNAIATPHIAHRAAVPPRVSARDAEHHGMLDGPGIVDPTTFQMLANEKDIDPRDPSAAIREVTIPVKRPLDAEPVDTTFAVYEAGRTLTYLPDPLAREVAARFFDHPNIADSEILTIPLYASSEWPDAAPFVIELYDDAADKPYFDEGTRRLRVPLPKGTRARLRLSMRLALDALEKMAVFGWMTDAHRDAQRSRAENGQHWMLTPWRVIELVHAVQRPLLAPDITSLSVPQRDPGSTSARPVINATCSINTTDRLDLFAEWHEPVDDPEHPESATIVADRLRHDLAFHVKVTTPTSYAQRLLGLPTGGFPDHTIAGDDTIGVNTIGEPPPTAKPPEPPPVQPKAHEFHDTRYRRIEYWFDATTRFREFLPAELLTETDAGTTRPVETHIKVTGQRAVTWIPSSARPPAPHVLYVVPTFGWTRETDETGKFSSRRHGGGLRVYLDRPWNVSGYGEMLGVLLPPAGFRGDPDTFPAGRTYKDCVTQWGNDPVWDSPFVAGIAPRRSDFPLARTAPDPSGTWLPPNAPPDERDQRPGAFQVTGLRVPRGPLVEVAPHDVRYDADRQLWFCDIVIDAGASYFPFVRLALARYHPISSGDLHLSDVVLADVMALTVDRFLNVTATANPGTRHVAVFGTRPYESSGHREARQAHPVSSFNLVTGQVEHLVPATISESTVIEVWVERLNERLGQDFGWERVSTAVVSGGDPYAAMSAPDASTLKSAARVVAQQTSAAERLHAHAVAQAHAVAEARMSLDFLADPLMSWWTLWEGDVTLPPMSGHRHRLVIAEFEEYLVDDAKPYDKVPTKKDRRLVFVEHVELGE